MSVKGTWKQIKQIDSIKFLGNDRLCFSWIGCLKYSSICMAQRLGGIAEISKIIVFANSSKSPNAVFVQFIRNIREIYYLKDNLYRSFCEIIRNKHVYFLIAIINKESFFFNFGLIYQMKNFFPMNYAYFSIHIYQLLLFYKI